MHGVLVLDKPAGPTSHDMVVLLRRILGDLKVGHIGTLDPFATGVLPLCVGKATRLSQYLGAGAKTYEAVVRFGFATDTGDPTGKPVGDPVAVRLQPEHLLPHLERFRGTIFQKPPQFSARKVQGVPLYKYARKGQWVKPPVRQVIVHEILLLGVEGSLARLRICCSPGTYIRSIAAELGCCLGCGAHLSALRRTAAGEFDLSQTLSADRMQSPEALEQVRQHLLPLEKLLGSFSRVDLNEAGLVCAGHGASLGATHLQRPDAGSLLEALAGAQAVLTRLYSPSGQLVAVARLQRLSPSLAGNPEAISLQPITVLL